MRYKTIAFTGHRPDKLGGYEWDSTQNLKIMERLKSIILDYQADTYIFGGAMGIDMMAFHICYKNKSQLQCALQVAIPFEQQCKYYKNFYQCLYRRQCARADQLIYVDELPRYEGVTFKEKLQKRNQYMVDHADLIIAVWNGSNSGTKNCIDYAKKRNKPIVILNPDTLQVSIIENTQLDLFQSL